MTPKAAVLAFICGCFRVGSRTNEAPISTLALFLASDTDDHQRPHDKPTDTVSDAHTVLTSYANILADG